jgi:hypothetical protein
VQPASQARVKKQRLTEANGLSSQHNETNATELHLTADETPEDSQYTASITGHCDLDKTDGR